MEFLEFVYKYFAINNIEILEINRKLWCYKKTINCDLDLYISAMQGIFIQEGAIILDAHALNIRRSMLSRLTVVSRAAKQSRMSDTTVCYIHERSILIERSLKACYKIYLMKKQRML